MDRLRAGYRMNAGRPIYNQRIEGQKGWFTSRQDYLNRLTREPVAFISYCARAPQYSDRVGIIARYRKLV